jgi:hypothetical protein
LEAAMLSVREVIGFAALILFVYVVGTSKQAHNGLDQIFDLFQLWFYRTLG